MDEASIARHVAPRSHAAAPPPPRMARINAVARFVRLAGGQRWLLIEAIGTLAVARIWLLIAPFRVVARHLGTPASAAVAESRRLSAAHIAKAREVRWSINRAAKRVPFRAVCLQQAVAAKLMLARRGIPATVRFGMAPTRSPGEEPRAHAWVSAGTVKVSGYPLDDDFVTVAQFE